VIGTARRRRDGEAKVLGQTRYVGDMPVFGLLYARPVLAAEAHAKLLGVDGTGRPTDYTDAALFGDPDPVPAVAELRAGELRDVPHTRLT